MRSIFEEDGFREIVGRLEAFSAGSERQWGKMTHSQMLEHTARAVEMAMGRPPMKQALIGKLIGWMFKGSFIGEKPFPKSSPTAPEFIIKDDPDFAATKARLIKLVEEFHSLGESGVDGNVHGFFGVLSGSEWGVTQYKHIDHHLRQFGS
jgi:hypothetical protein